MESKVHIYVQKLNDQLDKATCKFHQFHQQYQTIEHSAQEQQKRKLAREMSIEMKKILDLKVQNWIDINCSKHDLSSTEFYDILLENL